MTQFGRMGNRRRVSTSARTADTLLISRNYPSQRQSDPLARPYESVAAKRALTTEMASGHTAVVTRSLSKEVCFFFEPPEWLCLPDELDPRDGVFIPNTSTRATPRAVPK